MNRFLQRPLAGALLGSMASLASAQLITPTAATPTQHAAALPAPASAVPIPAAPVATTPAAAASTTPAAAVPMPTTNLTALGIAPGAQPSGLALPNTFTGAQPIYWQNTPIPVTLQVGVERQITFPAGVKVGLPSTVRQRLRTQSVAGTVHWLAYEPFTVQRVQIRERASGRTYLLDVRAVGQGGGVTPLDIIDAGGRPATTGLPDPASLFPAVVTDAAAAPTTAWQRSPNRAGTVPPNAATSAPTPTPGLPFDVDPNRYGYPQLVRYAYQQLYAPERLLGRLALPGLERVPVARHPLPLYRGGAVTATPAVGWTDGVHYVTAVALENRTRQRVRVDPRELRGRWLARALLQAELLPQRDRYGRDRAFVVLVSPVPFAEAVR